MVIECATQLFYSVCHYELVESHSILKKRIRVVGTNMSVASERYQNHFRVLLQKRRTNGLRFPSHILEESSFISRN